MCLEVMLLDSTDLKHLYFFSVYFHQYCNHWIICAITVLFISCTYLQKLIFKNIYSTRKGSNSHIMIVELKIWDQLYLKTLDHN